MRKDITEHTVDYDGTSCTEYHYNEVMFLTSESKEAIESNFDVWFSFGASWSDAPIDSVAIIRKLQNDYVDLSNAVIELAELVAEQGV